MGQVIPFIARVRDSGDWTATERARLEELAARLSAAGNPVEVMFGATDAGDPWCAVIDESGEVLIHVARIGTRFVIHSAVDDVLIEGADLHATLRERLNGEITPENEDAVVVPFSLAGRQAQTFIALVIAASFFYETLHPTPAMAATAPVAPMEAPPEEMPASDLTDDTVERDVTAQGARLTETAAVLSEPELLPSQPTPQASVTVATLAMELPALAAFAAALAAETGVAVASSPAAARVLRGGGGDDRIVGSAAAEWISGGDGDDTLIGGGGRDTLDGGAGDDTLEVTADVVAIGGAGADTFVIADPVRMGVAETFLGTILDFDALSGDRLVNSRGQELTLTAGGPGAEKNAPPATEGLAPSTLGPATVSDQLVRVAVDLDGDGTPDGFILVVKSGSSNAGRPPPDEEEEEAPPPPAEAEVVITCEVGQSLGWPDLA